MAIHPDYPGVSVQIFVDGKPVEEYEYEEEKEKEQPKTTTRYVECRTGAEFAIKTSFVPPFTPMDMSVRVYLDGSRMDGNVIRKHKMLKRTCTQHQTKWKDGPMWRASKFMFSKLSVVEKTSELSAEEDLGTLSHVGIISVVLTPILCIRKDPNPEGKKKELREIGMVSEEAVKGDVRSNVIALAPALAIKAPRYYDTENAKEPLVTFHFKYRSITALKSLGIIPRSPSPSQDSRLESVREEDIPQSSPKSHSGDATPTTIPQAKTASVTLAPPRQISDLPEPREECSLTRKDMLILIKHYRGSSDGLEGLPEKDLTILLSSYRADEPDGTPIKQEPVELENRVRIKRESNEDGSARGQGKKRKTEVIVLDD